MLENLLYFIVSCIALAAAAVFLVKSLSRIARFLGISEFSAAFIIMAIATSLPELFIGISSALSNNSELSLGNIIGSNILNLTLITGIIILLGKKIRTTKEEIIDSYFMIASILLIIVLYSIGSTLSRIDGVILLAFFLVSSYRTLKKRKKYKEKLKRKEKSKFFYFIIFIISLAILFISSKYAVEYASLLAFDLNLPQIVIGLVLLSVATTMPELVFGISAAVLKHKEMGIGDEIGTVIVNSALILGVVSVIFPIKAASLPFFTSAAFLLITGFIVASFIKTGRELKMKEGVYLILLYVLFLIIEFFIR